jgi:UDPglucose--hexose-1-phosphate uridylyltransferase
MTSFTLPVPADPQYRRDPVSGRWVLVSSERALRPIHEPREPELVVSVDECPFCPGHESWTPHESFAIRNGGSADGPGWLVRVVSNRYPAARTISSARMSQCAAHQFEQSEPGLGLHEVVVESPDHHARLGTMPLDQVALVLSAFRERLCVMRKDPHIGHVLVFRNQGRGGGASQPHPHSQILATKRIPTLIAAELAGSAEYFERSGRCVFCDMLEHEINRKTRLVETGPEFVAFCPFASRFPCELWLVPISHVPRFDEIDDGGLSTLAAILQPLVARVETLRQPPAYNFYLHTAPLDASKYAHYHWHIEIVPRLVGLAGFELGGDMFINPIPPEHAAGWWRRDSPDPLGGQQQVALGSPLSGRTR